MRVGESLAMMSLRLERLVPRSDAMGLGSETSHGSICVPFHGGEGWSRAT